MEQYEREEIREYLSRCKDLTPEERLKYIGKLRSSSYRNMTEEGRRFLLKSLERKLNE